MRKLIVLLTFLFLLISSLSFAKQDYPNTGNDDLSYALGVENEAFWNLDRTTDRFSITGTRINSNQTQTPLVVDLDGDGVNEIIVYDYPTFRLYQGSSLTPIAEFTPEVNSRISNFITFDVDGDNLIEIIFIEEQSFPQDAFSMHRIYFLEWDGATFTNESTVKTPLLTSIDGEMVIQCQKVEECLLVRITNFGIGGVVNVEAITFNKTNISVETSTLVESTTNVGFCMPKIRHMVSIDHDGDGNKEYIMSYMRIFASAPESIGIAYINASGSNVDLQKVINIQSPAISDLLSSGTCETNLAGNLFTSPVVFESDGDTATLETHIGFQVDDDSFVMFSFDDTASGNNDFKDNFPEACCIGTSCGGLLTSCADGALISNVMKANTFTDTGDLCTDGTNRCDFCVMGYDNSEETLDLLCGSHLTSQFFESRTFEFDISSLESPFNISEQYRNWNVITHSTQQSANEVTVSGDTDDLDEFLTAFGVFELDFTLFDELKLIFQNPKFDSVIISVDSEKVGQEDLLVLTDTNLFYLDDEFENSPANIIAFTINPCIDAGAIKVNSSMSIDITVTDVNGDEVSARAIVYEGIGNEQDSGFSANVTSGTVIPFAFVINKTISTATLKMFGRDVENPTQVDEITRTFSVATNGVEFDDCTTSELIEIIPEDVVITDPTLTEDATDDAITSGILALGGISGLAGTTIWIILMITFALGIFFRASEIGWSGNASLGAIAIVETLFIILGARLGILSIGLVVILVLLGVVILGVFLGRFLTGSGAGMANN